jgi:hypothetical protein
MRRRRRRRDLQLTRLSAATVSGASDMTARQKTSIRLRRARLKLRSLRLRWLYGRPRGQTFRTRPRLREQQKYRLTGAPGSGYVSSVHLKRMRVRLLPFVNVGFSNLGSRLFFADFLSAACLSACGNPCCLWKPLARWFLPMQIQTYARSQQSSAPSIWASVSLSWKTRSAVGRMPALML